MLLPAAKAAGIDRLKWKNYVGTYTLVTKEDLLRTLRLQADKMAWQLPGPPDDFMVIRYWVAKDRK